MRWQSLVTASPLPTDPDAFRALARQAAAKLDAVERALESPPTTEALLELLALLTVGRPAPSAAQLERPEAFWRWIWPLFSWQEGPALEEILGASPPRRFHALATDGRADLEPLWEEVDEDETSAGHPSGETSHLLRSEQVSAWIHLHQFGDGHQDLFWDPTFTNGVRVLHTDNRLPEVVVHDWRSAAGFLSEWFLPNMVKVLRAELAEDQLSGWRRGVRNVVTLGTIAALFLGTIVLIGLLLRACGLV